MTTLREQVESIVRSMVSYDDEARGVDELMALFAEHHCASCDMHACGDLPPSAALAESMANRLIDRLHAQEGRPRSLSDVRWPIERLNPQNGKPWTDEEKRAMGIDP